MAALRLFRPDDECDDMIAADWGALSDTQSIADRLAERVSYLRRRLDEPGIDARTLAAVAGCLAEATACLTTAHIQRRRAEGGR
ncbi:MAG TPA: hypothetical protein VN688_01030 [Gemmataceae bacterium]|nr:hypothetical protein [Gemmataceae bacterium]